MKPSILLIDDEPGIRLSFSGYLTEVGYAVQAVASRSEAQAQLLSKRFDAVLLDVNLPDGSGLDWIAELREGNPGMAIVVITGHGDIHLAVEAMRRGADNFLAKPVDMSELHVFLQKSLELGSLRRDHLTFQRLAKKDQPYFGESPAIKKVVELANVAAANDQPVLLLGETGSGKGVLARWIHNNSSKRSAPFVEVNCSGLRGELLASELFGHAKGSFTSAVQDKQGLIEVADGGTLFLDEIGDMDLAVQAQFLKVIEEKVYRRVGEVKGRRSEFRLICATNKDLLEETKNGRFRIDLYFRIYVFPIVIPSLRQRQEDIQPFIRLMFQSMGKPDAEVPPEVIRLLNEYSWPGNLRELRNVLERAVLLARGGPLSPAHFPGIEPLTPARVGNMKSGGEESSRILAVLAEVGGDVVKAAQRLGMSRATLYRRLKKIRSSEQPISH